MHLVILNAHCQFKRDFVTFLWLFSQIIRHRYLNQVSYLQIIVKKKLAKLLKLKVIKYLDHEVNQKIFCKIKHQPQGKINGKGNIITENARRKKMLKFLNKIPLKCSWKEPKYQTNVQLTQRPNFKFRNGLIFQ